MQQALQRCERKKQQPGIFFGIIPFMKLYEPRLKDFLLVVGVALLLTTIAYLFHLSH